MFICIKVLLYIWKCSGRSVIGVLMDRMQFTFSQNGSGEKKDTKSLPNIYEREEIPILWAEA